MNFEIIGTYVQRYHKYENYDQIMIIVCRKIKFNRYLLNVLIV